ncbi:MAG: mechanosensitive ion channel family protein [Candidatus Altiarchaeota archaeon]
MILEDALLATYFGNTLLEYIKALTIILLSVIVGKLAYLIINRYLKKLTEKTNTRLDDMLIDAIEEPLLVAIVAGGIYIALQTLTVPPETMDILSNILTAIFILDAVWLAIRTIDIVIKEILMPLTSKTNSTLDDQLIPIISKGFKAMIAILGLLIILSRFGIDITALIAGLGIGGLAIALASKDTVENMFGAFAILLDKPFMVKDRIIIEGVTGDVLEVGLRSTRILTLDNTELYIPNSKIVTSRLENISRPDRSIVKNVKLNLTYETPGEKVKEALETVKKILAETDGVDHSRQPTAVFNKFDDSSLEIYVKYWVEDYLKHYDTGSRVNLQIKERFEKAGIAFAYPTQKIVIAK